jgi:glycosyltransferase involved in cell wall biosynthesis
MKILFLTENFPPETNAAANRVHERARFWVGWGHDVTVITGAPNFPQGKLYEGYKNRWFHEEKISGVNVLRVKTFIAPNQGAFFRALDFVSFMFSGFAAGLVVKRPDVVVATSPQFLAAVAGWLISVFRKRPFVLELGDIWPASIIAVGAMKESALLRLMEKFERYLYRKSACVVAVTPAFKENLVGRGIDENKVAVVINGVDLAQFTPVERDDLLAAEWGLQDSFVVGYLGTHGMAHALGNVLDAAEILRDRPEIKFLFIGNGAERNQLIASARERRLENVVFIQPQPREMMPKAWGLCDLGLVHLKDTPVFSEVIPSKIFEAMAMKRPILIASPEGVASRLVLADGAGRWVPPENPKALAEAVCRLADDDSLRANLASNALTASLKYGRHRQAQEMLQVLEIADAGWGARAGTASDGRNSMTS